MTFSQPRDEYGLRYGSRGRHRKLVEEGALVRLDPDVAVRFPSRSLSVRFCQGTREEARVLSSDISLMA
jgi:hypothetical protein